MKRILRKVIRIMFYAITGIAVALWVLSASSLDSPTLLPTVVCGLSSAWLVFAVLISKERGEKNAG